MFKDIQEHNARIAAENRRRKIIDIILCIIIYPILFLFVLIIALGTRKEK